MTSILEIPISLNRKTILESLSLQPESSAALEVGELIKAANAQAKPRALFRESFIENRGINTVTIDGVTFTSRALRANLDTINRVFPFIATTGLEPRKFGLKQDDILRKYWLEIIDLNLLKSCMQYLREEIQRRFKFGKLSTMNPGSGERGVWPIEQQFELFSLFSGAESKIGVRLLPTFLMQPERTTSGFLFPAETSFENCQLCKREGCNYRRAPFDPDMWERAGIDGGVKKW
jgi:hypothetical protein